MNNGIRNDPIAPGIACKANTSSTSSIPNCLTYLLVWKAANAEIKGIMNP